MKEIALHMLDIAQNSIRAGAGEIRISIDESLSSDTYTLTIGDNGKGMDAEAVRRTSDPWFTSRTTRKVGMGLPLLQMNASLSGGKMTVSSEPGMGTRVTAIFGHRHPDRPPAGDIGGTVTMLIMSNPAINFVYRHSYEGEEWSISTKEIKEELGSEALTDLSVARHLKQLITDNIAELTNSKETHDKY